MLRNLSCLFVLLLLFTFNLQLRPLRKMPPRPRLKIRLPQPRRSPTFRCQRFRFPPTPSVRIFISLFRIFTSISTRRISDQRISPHCSPMRSGCSRTRIPSSPLKGTPTSAETSSTTWLFQTFVRRQPTTHSCAWAFPRSRSCSRPDGENCIQCARKQTRVAGHRIADRTLLFGARAMAQPAVAPQVTDND